MIDTPKVAYYSDPACEYTSSAIAFLVLCTFDCRAPRPTDVSFAPLACFARSSASSVSSLPGALSPSVGGENRRDQVEGNRIRRRQPTLAAALLI